MEKELKRKLKDFAEKQANKVEDIDEMVLYDLVMDGAKWMYEQLNPEPIEFSVDLEKYLDSQLKPIDFSVDLEKYLDSQLKPIDFSVELQKYLDETPREQILKDWEKSKKCDEIGPTVEEFIKQHKQNG